MNFFKVLTSIIFLFSTFSLHAQDAIDKDSLGSEIKYIDIIDIPTKSADASIRISNINELIIDSEDVVTLKLDSEYELSLIDSLLYIDRQINLISKSIRHLQNKQVFWQFQSDILAEKENALSSQIANLELHKSSVDGILRTWEATYARAQREERDTTILLNVEELLKQCYGLRKDIIIKRSELLHLQSLYLNKGLDLSNYLKEIDKAINLQQSEVLVRHQNSIFQLNISDRSNTAILPPLKNFINLEVKQLFYYLQRNIFSILFQLFLLAVLVFIFKQVKETENQTPNLNSDNNVFRIIVQQHFNLAFIVGIFLSIVIFRNQPILFRDLSRLIISIPLLILVRHVLPGRLYMLNIWLFAMLFVQVFMYAFPPNHLIYRLSISIIAITEFLILYGILKYFNSNKIPHKPLEKLIWAILLLHMGFVITGFMGVVIGATVLAEWAINQTLLNAFSCVLIYTLVLILKGVINISLQHKAVVKLNFINRFGEQIKAKSELILNSGGVVLLVYVMLRNMRVERIVIESISAFLKNEISLGSITFSLGGIILFFLVIWLSIIISRIIQTILEKDVLSKLNMAKGLPHTIAMMVRYTIITLGAFIAVSAAGLPLQNLSILLGAFGVGIGFGLQNIFNNLVSGLILLFERPIQIGDTIEVGELIGNVKSIGIRSSNVRTFDGAEVIVPNGQLISSEVVNWTLSDQTRRIEVLAGVAYGSDPHRVKELLLSQLKKHPDIIKNPEPSVYFNSMGESSLDFRLLFWTANIGEWLRIQSEVTFMVHDILKTEGIEIPFPQRDLHIRSIDESININKNE